MFADTVAQFFVTRNNCRPLGKRECRTTQNGCVIQT